MDKLVERKLNRQIENGDTQIDIHINRQIDRSGIQIDRWLYKYIGKQINQIEICIDILDRYIRQKD